VHSGCEWPLRRGARTASKRSLPSSHRCSVLVPIAAQCHALQQMWPAAIAAMRHALEERAPRGQALAHLAFVFARAGQDEEALRIHANLLDQWQRGNDGALEVALVYAGLRDFDQAFGWLERAADDSSSMPSHQVQPGHGAGFRGSAPRPALRPAA
jgi:tetratricopeptide (TPR) repeat protein